TNSFTGALVTRVRRITNAFETLSDRVLWDLSSLSIKFISAAILLFFYSWIISVVLFIWLLIYISVTFYAYKKKYPYDIDAAAEKDSMVTARLADALTNIFTIKIFSGTEQEAEGFRKVTETRKKVRKLNWDIATWINLVQGVLLVAVEIILLYLTLTLYIAGS